MNREDRNASAVWMQMNKGDISILLAERYGQGFSDTALPGDGEAIALYIRDLRQEYNKQRRVCDSDYVTWIDSFAEDCAANEIDLNLMVSAQGLLIGKCCADKGMACCWENFAEQYALSGGTSKEQDKELLQIFNRVSMEDIFNRGLTAQYPLPKMADYERDRLAEMLALEGYIALRTKRHLFVPPDLTLSSIALWAFAATDIFCGKPANIRGKEKNWRKSASCVGILLSAQYLIAPWEILSLCLNALFGNTRFFQEELSLILTGEKDLRPWHLPREIPIAPPVISTPPRAAQENNCATETAQTENRATNKKEEKYKLEE